MTLFSRQGHVLPRNSKDLKGKPLHVRDRVCWRCGGLGGSDKWKHTGWTCYRCGGSGTDPVRETVKLYTQDELDKLNARKAKADAKKAAARAEVVRLEQERRDREKAEMVSDYQDLLDRIGDELAHGDNEILQNVVETITVRVKDPSDRQIEVVNKIIADRTKERERLAGARHVGEVKKRQVFTLTLIHTQSRLIDEFPTIWSHWSLFTDENGCKIACKSAPWTLGLRREHVEGGAAHEYFYPKGQTIKVKATVIEHTTDKRGEPVTYINRPKAAE